MPSYDVEAYRRRILSNLKNRERTDEDVARERAEIVRLINSEVTVGNEEKSKYWDVVYNSELIQDMLKRPYSKDGHDKIMGFVRRAVRSREAADRPQSSSEPVESLDIIERGGSTWKNWDWLCGHIMVASPEEMRPPRPAPVSDERQVQLEVFNPAPKTTHKTHDIEFEYGLPDANAYIARIKEAPWLLPMDQYQLPGMGMVSSNMCGGYWYVGCTGSHTDGGDLAHRMKKIDAGRYKPYSCGRVSCPKCFTLAIGKKAMSLTNVVMSHLISRDSDLYGDRRRREAIHIIVAPNDAQIELLKSNAYRMKFERKMIAVLRQVGYEGAAIMLHPYTFSKGLAQAKWDIHYHLIGIGWANPGKSKRDKRGRFVKGYRTVSDIHTLADARSYLGAVIKAKGGVNSRGDVFRLASYLLSHAWVPPVRDERPDAERMSAGHTIRYMGTMKTGANREIFRTGEFEQDIHRLYDDILSGNVLSGKAKARVQAGMMELKKIDSQVYKFNPLGDESMGYHFNDFRFGHVLDKVTVETVPTKKGTKKEYHRVYGKEMAYTKGPVRDVTMRDNLMTLILDRTSQARTGQDKTSPAQKDNLASAQSATLPKGYDPGTHRHTAPSVKAVVLRATYGTPTGLDTLPYYDKCHKNSALLTVLIGDTTHMCPICKGKLRKLVPVEADTPPPPLSLDDPECDFHYSPHGTWRVWEPRGLDKGMPIDFYTLDQDDTVMRCKNDSVSRTHPHVDRMSVRMITIQKYAEARSLAKFQIRQEIEAKDSKVHDVLYKTKSGRWAFRADPLNRRMFENIKRFTPRLAPGSIAATMEKRASMMKEIRGQTRL